VPSLRSSRQLPPVGPICWSLITRSPSHSDRSETDPSTIRTDWDRLQPFPPFFFHSQFGSSAKDPRFLSLHLITFVLLARSARSDSATSVSPSSHPPSTTTFPCHLNPRSSIFIQWSNLRCLLFQQTTSLMRNLVVSHQPTTTVSTLHLRRSLMTMKILLTMSLVIQTMKILLIPLFLVVLVLILFKPSRRLRLLQLQFVLSGSSLIWRRVSN
jgi:hypothetical protein